MRTNLLPGKWPALCRRAGVYLLLIMAACSTQAAKIVLLGTDNRLRTIDSAAPGTVLQTLTVTGLSANEQLVGIDFRPATGELFALGNSNHLYIIAGSGAATLVSPPAAFTLSGTTFGFNFNATVDRIRVVSDADQDLRLNPSNGALAATDVTLAYAVGDAHAGANPNIIGCAYVNSYAGAVATTLYGIDSALDILVIQNPPNSGTLNTVGPLGINASAIGGFDIWDFNNQAFAALSAPGDAASGLYTINLATGAATLLGTIGGGVLVRGVAVVPTGSLRFTAATFFGSEQAGVANISVSRIGGTNGGMTISYGTAPGTADAGLDYGAVSGFLTFAEGQTNRSFQVPIYADNIPEFLETFTVSISAAPGDALIGAPSVATVQIQSADALNMFLLTVSNRLLRVSTNLSVIDHTNTITGLLANEKILGIDFRPADGRLYGLGSSNRLYSINETSGVAALVGASPAFVQTNVEYSFDFNPTVDRIRVSGSNRQNLRLNPNDGNLAATDTALAYAAGDPNQTITPAVFASAYTRNFAGALTTTLYVIDSAADALAIQNPPNNGTLNTVGPLGVDVTAVGEFDITGTNNAAFAVMTRNGSANAEVFAINLTTGAAQSLGVIASPGDQVRGMAIQDPPPRLQIARAGTNVVVAWPAASAGYVLEMTSALGPASWSADPVASVLVNDTRFVTNSAIESAAFYRLKK